MPVVRKCVYCGKSMIRSTYEMAIHVEQCRKKIETVQKTITKPILKMSKKQLQTYSKNVHSNTLCKR